VKIVIAGGGTGGHLFPGVAIAEEFRRRSTENEVLFIGTNRGLEARVLPQIGFPLATLEVEGVKGRGLIRSLAALAKVPRSLLQSRRIIRDFGPGIVIGVGGYASGPAVLAAHFMGVPTVIAEQNAIPGETNRILGKFADRIFVSFPETARRFRKDRVRVTGNPIRAAIAGASRRERKPGDAMTLLVFGGSQGAHRINVAVLEALPHLGDLKGRIRMIHQTGKDDLENVTQGYRDYAVEAKVLPFITDMAAAYAESDLLICRAGATSIAEITASGKAAIFIPFPFAVNDHQTKNAELLVNRGAAAMIPERDLTGESLSGIIRRLAQDPGKIEEMGRMAASLGNARAAADIVDECMALLTERRTKVKGKCLSV
jgi:UDP-N-acetylglucosamine--N-acetylmuramyl-(pentapeptide) pyrophosphoryl-undecaprenol N-acetylglucosamine transferase